MDVEAMGTTLGGDTEDTNWVAGAHETTEGRTSACEGGIMLMASPA